jgi:hypothetical protein
MFEEADKIYGKMRKPDPGTGRMRKPDPETALMRLRETDRVYADTVNENLDDIIKSIEGQKLLPEPNTRALPEPGPESGSRTRVINPKTPGPSGPTIELPGPTETVSKTTKATKATKAPKATEAKVPKELSKEERLKLIKESHARVKAQRDKIKAEQANNIQAQTDSRAAMRTAQDVINDVKEEMPDEFMEAARKWRRGPGRGSSDPNEFIDWINSDEALESVRPGLEEIYSGSIIDDTEMVDIGWQDTVNEIRESLARNAKKK